MTFIYPALEILFCRWCLALQPFAPGRSAQRHRQINQALITATTALVSFVASLFSSFLVSPGLYGTNTIPTSWRIHITNIALRIHLKLVCHRKYHNTSSSIPIISRHRGRPRRGGKADTHLQPRLARRRHYDQITPGGCRGPYIK